MGAHNAVVNTVLGPVPADELGVVSAHSSLLSVVPGAEYAHDITIDRAEVFATLSARLVEFRELGGRTVVDTTGMFHGRDVKLLEGLSRATGVHVVASTGMGPEALLGGYYLTPQTNPPTPWPAEKWADLFGKEVLEGMVVPRVERRAGAGLIATAATRSGITENDASLFRGAARAALATGAPVSLRHGADAVADLQVALAEGLDASRVVVAGLDRRDAVAAGAAAEVARAGVHVALDHVGTDSDEYVCDAERVALVVELLAAGLGDRILLSVGTPALSFGEPADDLPLSLLLSSFVPALKAAGVSDEDVQRILVDNPRDLLTVKGN